MTIVVALSDGADRIAIASCDHGVELAIEHRTLDGWRIGRRIMMTTDEARQVADALRGDRGAT
jgi:hypothetical protein